MPSAVESLVTLHDRLLAVDLPLELGGVDDARRTRAELVDQIEDYLLPRLRSIDAPLLAVIGGSTGAGKSTITNTLVGAEVSRAGVLRPTTRAPVLVCNPADRDWFDRGGVLADLARLSGEPPPGTSGLQLVESPAVPVGLGLLDSPDIDSVETAHHDLAAQLLGAADLWLFVTTAARYADAVPWAYLARAQERATALAVVVNRIPPGGADEIMPHLRSMLAEHGLGGALTFAVTEVPLVDGRIPGGVEPVRAWLDALVADASAREAMIRSTLDGALASLVGRVERTAVAVDAHAASADALGALMERRYDEALHEVAGELDGGNLLHSEVLDRWQDHVGTGEWMARVQSGIGRLRNRLRSMVTGRAAPEAEVRGEVQASLAMLVREAADRAALDVVSGWTALPGGRQVLDGGERGLDRATPLLAGRVEREIEAWQEAVFDLVRDRAGSKLAVARTLSLGINGVGVALMVAVFSHTAGLTGGEVAVAGGTAAVSQAVLSAVFGEQAVRDLARAAREDLLDRLRRCFDDEQARFGELLAAVPDHEVAAGLRAAAADVPRRVR